MNALRILVKGQVQGLGFRPFVYRLAQKLKLSGAVSNTRQGVEIHVEGPRAKEIVAGLKQAPPSLARVSEIRVSKAKSLGLSEFRIIASNTDSAQESALDVLPDIATCPDCLADIADNANRRYRYPFTNCTQCGPRYSIIHTLPYDRPRTTMKAFTMCAICGQEYENPENRRFHAQPNCCPACGPKLALLYANGTVFDDISPIETAAKLLSDGRIVAVKSIAGYHIACDATKPDVVAELRKRKDRPDKPLAVMCPDIDTVKRFCLVDTPSRKLLESLARPVVLLPKRLRGNSLAVADSVSPATNCWGVMLAYAPLHYLILQPPVPQPANPQPVAALSALVMTSANIRDQPVITELPEILAKLGSVVDYVLTHDRPIANRADDSVVFSEGATIMVRRSRGYAPTPVILADKQYRLKPLLACGAQQKNTFSLASGNRVYLSPHIGDLDTADSMGFFTETLDLYRKWYDIKPELVACDLHPDYLSTRFAENLSLKSHRPLVRVQHHHAHIASVIAEHNLKTPVLGIALDGTGLGTDGKIWGCELLLCTLKGFRRLGHLRYLPLIGGEAAIAEPARIAAAYLAYLFGPRSIGAIPSLADFQDTPAQLNIGANVVFTSSTGRLFDCVSALLGICTESSYDGQAPARLEAAADPGTRGDYFLEDHITARIHEPLIIDPKPWLSAITADIAKGLPAAHISRKFHNTFISALAFAAKTIGRASKVKTVCLSGGSFQNRILLAGLTKKLLASGFKVFINQQVPPNDGGVSLGQAVVASAQTKR